MHRIATACLIALGACANPQAPAPPSPSDPGGPTPVLTTSAAPAPPSPAARAAVAAAPDAGAPPGPAVVSSPPYSCAHGDGEAIARVLAHGRVPAPCAELSGAAKAAQQQAIATAVVAAHDKDAAQDLAFTWGCTSHGDTPVVVEYTGPHDETGVDLWTVRDGRPRRVQGFTSPAPDEWSASDRIEIGPSGDLDGDGAADSIIELSHHASAWGTAFAYRVMLGGEMVALPSDLVVRPIAGDHDGVVRPPALPRAPAALDCSQQDRDMPPDLVADCNNQPTAGYVKADACGPWDWEQHRPAIVVLGKHNALVPLPRADVTAIVAATSADRAALAREPR